MSTIKVYKKCVYGVDRIYPSCPIARKFLKLIGTATFHAGHLKCIEDIGYKIEYVVAP